MTNEHDRALAALGTGIQMEIDGKEYYLKAADQSGNELGHTLLRTLAGEEDIHRQKFENIFEALRRKKAWPVTRLLPTEAEKRLKTIFRKAAEEVGAEVKPHESEIHAVQTAMTMENKTFDFYKQQGGVAAADAERDFYNALAAEERQHYDLLFDYNEYLKDPGGYFVRKERHSLDGG